MMITKRFICPFCGKPHDVTAPETAWAKYEDGELAQRCFTMLTVTEREQIISHICPACQEDVFGPADEDMENDYAQADFAYSW